MPDAVVAAEERRPLLHGDDAPTTAPARAATAGEEPTAAASAASAAAMVDRSRTPLRVVIPGVAMLFLSEWCAVLIGVSMGALMERSICARRYPDVVDSLRDPRCKANAVQAELSTVRGWESTFILVPGILTAIPYNMMAEAYGPKLVVLLMLLGQMLTHATELIVCLNPQIFDTRWVWLCATLVVIGGGPVVFTSMVHYIGNSISTEKSRATTFFFCTAVAMLGGLTAGPAGFLFMKIGPVFTKCVVLGLGAAMFCLQLVMPADAIKRKQHATATTTSPGGTPAKTRTLSQIASVCKRGLGDFRALIAANAKVCLLLSTLVAYTIAAFSGRFRLQYATKRFDWTWDEAGFIPSVASGIKLAMVGAFLPAASHWLLDKRKLSAAGKDLWLSRVLVAVLLLGSLALAVAPTGVSFLGSVCLYELSAGHVPATVSLITSVVDDQHKGVVFGYVAVFEAIGGIISGPFLASLFNVGLDWGTNWYGLPFLFVGILQIPVLMILFATREKEP